MFDLRIPRTLLSLKERHSASCELAHVRVHDIRETELVVALRSVSVVIS